MAEIKGNPIVSIILPYHNTGFPIKNSLSSIFRQDYEKFELIIVDDASTDNTPEIVNNFIDGLTANINIKHLKMKINSGVSAARNFGIKNCSGEIIVFCDDDDIFSRDRLTTHVDALAKKLEYPVFHFGSSVKVYPNGYEVHLKVSDDLSQVTAREIIRYALTGAQPKDTKILGFPASTLAITRKVAQEVGGFNEAYRRSEDAEYVIRGVLAGALVMGTQKEVVFRTSKLFGTTGPWISSIYELKLIEDYWKSNLSLREKKLALNWIRIKDSWYRKQYFCLMFRGIKVFTGHPYFLLRKIIFAGLPRFVHEFKAD